MSSTSEQAAKAVETTRRKHGKDFFKKIAPLAQKAWEENGRKPRGFAANPELARKASLKGLATRRAKRGDG